MGGAGEQRWAPFPVQDWSTMPDDLLGPAGAARAGPWGPPSPATLVPPARGRRRWVPLVVLLCLGLVVATGTWLARRAPEPRTAALAYVPADGDALWQRLDTTREAGTRTATVVTESARFAGADGLESGDPALTTRVLHQDHADAGRARLWRTTTTQVDEVGVPTQTVRYLRVRGGVELAGEQAGEEITAYEPALVELPADVAPGASWRSDGSVGAVQDYTSTFTAAAGADGCLDVTGELVLRARGSQAAGRRTSLARTWCPGRGMVAASESSGATRTVLTAVPAPAPAPRTTRSAPIAWSAPRRWAPRRWDTITVDPTTEELQAMAGRAATDVTPVVTAAGLVVRALEAPHDLVATTPKTPDAWTPAWRVHPGGTVLSLAAYGEVLLVTTSERRVVAYSEAGSRLWQADLPDLATTAAAQVSDADAVLVDRSGRVVRFRIADGTVRWEHGVGTDVDRAPAVGAGLVAVVDRSGTVSALDAASGAPRWDRAVGASGVGVVGDAVVAVVDRDVVALEPADGRTRWTTQVGGRSAAPTTFAGRVLLVAREETLLLDADGRVVRRLPGYLGVDVTSTHLVGWAADRLDVVDPGGGVVATWPTSAADLVPGERPGLATPQGVYLFAVARGWTFDSWTSAG